MQSRWRAPLITLAVIVVIVAGGTHFLATGSLRDALISLHGGHRGGTSAALAALHGSGATPSGTPAADSSKAPIGIRLEATGKDHDTPRVADVTTDSIAAEAGLMKGDVISSIDGKPAAGLTMEEVATILERPAGCAVGIVRGERTLTVTLPSRPT
jgi:membrane-associated protease RseP (regulator of RpoE activity)